MVTEACRGFIKGRVPDKLTGCEGIKPETYSDDGDLGPKVSVDDQNWAKTYFSGRYVKRVSVNYVVLTSQQIGPTFPATS